MKSLCSEIAVAPNLFLYHRGPPLEYGPLPSLFYFSLSGPDSLCLDPFNQPVEFLLQAKRSVRVFSMTLPGHENRLPATQAMKIWAEEIEKGKDPVGDFLSEASRAVEFAIRERFVDPNHMSVAGLSRGAFLALHLAACIESKFRSIVGFAPLTRLGKIKEFAYLQNHPAVNRLDLIHLAKTLSDQKIKLFIGNEDTRVGTRECFELAMALVEQKQQRSSKVELVIYPSIGQMGHGTPPEIFQQGVSSL